MVLVKQPLVWPGPPNIKMCQKFAMLVVMRRQYIIMKNLPEKCKMFPTVGTISGQLTK